MEKLTIETCFKYSNARIISENESHEWKDVSEYLCDDCMNIRNNVKNIDIDDCKLILRPLKNSLVQAEKEYLLKTFLKPNDYDFDCLFFDEIEESIAFLLDILPFNMVAKLIDYFRSISIDIDGLKEKGLCIYENK